MSLERIVKQIFKPIMQPEKAKREINGANPTKTAKKNNNWKEESVEYAAPFESDEPYPGIFRVAKAWEEPPVVQFYSVDLGNGTLGHVLPYGAVGTDNIGLPSMIAMHMQELRNGNLNPRSQNHVALFQNMMANNLALFYPLALAKIILDQQGASALRGLRLTPILINGMEMEQPPELFYSNVDGIEVKEHLTQTIGGAVSRAHAARGYNYDSIKVRVEGAEEINLDVSFIAIHRAGILPSIMGAYMAEKFGMRTQIVGVDVKRQNLDSHFGKVTGAKIQPPAGYTLSPHSICRDGFVMPTKTEFGKGRKQVHVVADPMFATGVSGYEALKTYQQISGCEFRDVYFISLFAGGYDGFERVKELGVNVIVLSHDQADLTSNGYIQPGLGDAGDKLSRENFNDTHGILKSMLHLAERRDDSYLRRTLNDYAMQITGKAL